MENANPFIPVPPNGLHVRITQELNKLRAISTMINSYLEQPLNDFMNSHNVIEMDDPESDDVSVDKTFVSPFLDLDVESDDDEVLNELDEYGNAGNVYRKKIINSLDEEDLAFPYAGDGVRIFPDDVTSPATVIFDEKKLGSSKEFHVDDS
ncbi:hypothetical protein Tco_1142257 [Tanacetum coccineum]